MAVNLDLGTGDVHTPAAGNGSPPAQGYSQPKSYAGITAPSEKSRKRSKKQAAGKMAGKPRGVAVRAQLGPGGSLHVRHQMTWLEGGRAFVEDLDDGSYCLRDFRTITLGDEVSPASAGVKLIGPATWSDGEPKKLVWIQLAECGSWRGHPAGPFEMTPATWSEIVRNFVARGIPVAFDFEHASEQDPTSGSIPERGAPAQGWIHRLDNRGQDGLWGLVEWLEYARTGIKAGNFAFVSPAIRFNSRDPVSGEAVGARLTSAAITNQPFLSGLEGLRAASDRPGGASMAFQFKGGPRAVLAGVKSAAAAPKVEVTVNMGGGQQGLVHKPHEYMPDIRACLGLHPMCMASECLEHLERLRDHVDKCGDAEGMHEGIDLKQFTRPLRYLVGADHGDTWEDVFDAVEALIKAAIGQTDTSGGLGPAFDETTAGSDRTAASTETVATSAAAQSNTAASSAAGTTQEGDAAMADANTTKMTELENSVATMTLQFTSVQAKVNELTTALSAKDGEIAALKAELAKRDDDARTERVSEAYETYKDSQKLTDTHKSAMLIVLKNDPATFEKLYPRITGSQRHLLSNVSGAIGSGDGHRRDKGTGIVPEGPAKGPSLAEAARALSAAKGISLERAQAIVLASARKARAAA